ncbi:MAG: hypothetical protein MUF84_04990 [Anaerolineae bacterium]|jgi:hypothetical protein|nr:hypothetical protein [Anaerolineae bacterium]
MTATTCVSFEPHGRIYHTFRGRRDACSDHAEAGGAFPDPADALTGDPDRAAALADRIAALGEPWAGRFVAYIASRVGAGVREDDDPADVRARLVDWLQLHRVDALVRALLNAWPCWRPAAEPHQNCVESVGRAGPLNQPVTRA